MPRPSGAQGTVRPALVPESPTNGLPTHCPSRAPRDGALAPTGGSPEAAPLPSAKKSPFLSTVYEGGGQEATVPRRTLISMLSLRTRDPVPTLSVTQPACWGPWVVPDFSLLIEMVPPPPPMRGFQSCCCCCCTGHGAVTPHLQHKPGEHRPGPVPSCFPGWVAALRSEGPQRQGRRAWGCTGSCSPSVP